MSIASDRPDVSRKREGKRSSSAPALRRCAQRLRERWENSGPFDSLDRLERPMVIRRIQLGGWGLLAVEFLILCWWSSVLSSRFALTKDFAGYEQAAYLIAHGTLDPHSTIFGVTFWRNNSEFLMWPLALFLRIWPHLTALQWLQDLALVCTQVVALNWMCDLAASRARRDGSPAIPAAILTVGIVLLVANPWIAWTVSFDVHLEAFASLFALCAARDLYRDRGRAWLWVVLAVASCPAGTTYVLGVGVSAILVGRRWWRRGTIVAAAALSWLLFIQVIHGATGTGPVEYGHLALKTWNGPVPKSITTGKIAKAVIEHPWRLLQALWYNRVNVWANIAPGGIIGLFWLPLMIPGLLVAAEGGFSVLLFSRPGFQSIALAPIVSLGTVAVLLKFRWNGSRRRRWGLFAVCGLLLANSLAWAIVWLPQVSKTWLLVDKGAASVLSGVSKQIKPGDEVVASQGIVGGFANRRGIYIVGPAATRIPVTAKTVWIILAPQQGIEDVEAHGFFAQIGQFEKNPQLRQVAASHGVWAFKLTAEPGQRWLYFQNSPKTVTPAWTLAGVAAKQVEKGPRTSWYAASTGSSGYVLSNAYWREGSGSYRVSLSISVTESANFELWNDDTNRLLKRVVVHNTHGIKTVVMNVKFRSSAPQVYGGWGMWRMTPVPPDGDALEVRVWSPGGRANRISVYGLTLARVGTAS